MKIENDKDGLVISLQAREKKRLVAMLGRRPRAYFLKDRILLRNSKKRRKRNFVRTLHSTNMTKGAIVFLIEEAGRLNVAEVRRGLEEVFGLETDAGKLIAYLEDLKDRNILSRSGGGVYHPRKTPYSVPETGQIKDLISHAPSIARKYERWKRDMK